MAKKGAVQISAEELETRFWDREHERTHIFEQSRRQQQLDIALAAVPWMKAEDTRNKIFQRFLFNALETFANNQDSRVGRFKDMLDKCDKIFRFNDDKRQAGFNDASSTRLKLFEASHEKREKAVTKFAEFQERLYDQHRTQRQADCQRLIEQFRELFSKMIRQEMATFKDAQRRREEGIHAASVRQLYIALILSLAHTVRRLQNR